MKVTKYHIELYKRVGGDVDHLQRIGTLEEKSIENQNMIVKIEELLFDLKLLKSKTTNSDYAKISYQKFKQICENEKVISQMKKLISFR